MIIRKDVIPRTGKKSQTKQDNFKDATGAKINGQIAHGSPNFGFLASVITLEAR